MKENVKPQAHDVWFRREVERGLREADDPTVRHIPHREVRAKWRRRRAELKRSAGGKRG